MSTATLTDELTARAIHAWRVLRTHEPGDATAAAIALDYVQECCDDRPTCLSAIRKVAADEWWEEVCRVLSWAIAQGTDKTGWVQSVHRWIAGTVSQYYSYRPKTESTDGVFRQLEEFGVPIAGHIDALVAAL